MSKAICSLKQLEWELEELQEEDRGPKGSRVAPGEGPSG